MEPMIFRTLESKEDIDCYLEKFESFVGVRLPYDYTQRSRIVGAFQNDHMVAGYMLVTKPAFRSLIFVPDAVKQQHRFFRNDQYEMMEVNGLWISASLKSAEAQFKVWMTLLKDVLLARKKYILLMSDLRNKNIGNIHSLTNPETLYEGAPLLMAGDKSHDQIRVSYTTRWQLIANLPRYWAETRNRGKRSSKRAKRRAYARVISQAETQ